MATAAPLTVIGYVRVSTDKQDIGPEVQIAALEAEAQRRGWNLDLRREDAASAKSLKNRPVLAGVLADLKAGRAEALVVSKVDRLSRSVADFARILDDAERQRWGVVALDLGVDTTTITGRAMAQVTVVFAEMERRRIAERTRDAMAMLPDDVRDRMRNGGRPRAPLADSTAERVQELRAGGASLKAIADTLTGEGHTTPTGAGRWYPATVKRVLDATSAAVAEG
ncbi:recombinase family protein [Isoptericola jiangsuensis]|uniref:recombinase family protein n=1 Tax=Isoptericola jiangsuensis TaxID=548579 RepID=UPI003AAE8DE1